LRARERAVVVRRKPLTPTEYRAAEMLGQGATQAAVAAELDTSSTSIRRLLGRDDFKALVEEARVAAAATEPGEDDRDDEAEAIFRAGMEATMKTTGLPNHAMRMNALIEREKYRAIRARGEIESSEPVVERVFISPDHPDFKQVTDKLDATPPNQSVFVLLASRDVINAEAAIVYLLGEDDGQSEPVSTPYEPVRPHVRGIPQSADPQARGPQS
jgi:DNA-binding CsgD family transcriptional regulator